MADTSAAFASFVPGSTFSISMNQCAMLLNVAVHCTYLMFAGFVTEFFVRNALDSESLNVTFAFVDICTDLFWKNTKFRWPAAMPSASATDRLMAEVRSRAADSAQASALFCSSLRVTYSLPRSSARPTNDHHRQCETDDDRDGTTLAMQAATHDFRMASCAVHGVLPERAVVTGWTCRCRSRTHWRAARSA